MMSSILKFFFTFLFLVSYYIFLVSSVVLIQKKFFNLTLAQPSKPPSTAIWQLEFLTLTGKKLQLVEEAKWYYLDIVGVSSTERHGSGTVNLDGKWKLFYSRADPSVCTSGCELTNPSCQTVCQIGFLWDHGSAY